MGLGFHREVLSFGHAAPHGIPGTGPAVTTCGADTRPTNQGT